MTKILLNQTLNEMNNKTISNNIKLLLTNNKINDKLPLQALS